MVILLYGFIYETTNLINGKKYIGQKKYDKKGEWKYYLGSGILLDAAVKKYGKENFERKILCECETREEANQLEKTYIAEVDAVNNPMYYNIAIGGQGNPVSGEKNYMYGRTGALNPWYGKHPSEETRRLIKEHHDKRKGKDHPLYGRKKSEESKRKQSEHMKNKGNKKCICIETEVVYESLKQAGKANDIDPVCICNACKGKTKTAGGYHWEYYKD